MEQIIITAENYDALKNEVLFVSIHNHKLRCSNKSETHLYEVMLHKSPKPVTLLIKNNLVANDRTPKGLDIIQAVSHFEETGQDTLVIRTQVI
jgi:hypothetical protein